MIKQLLKFSGLILVSVLAMSSEAWAGCGNLSYSSISTSQSLTSANNGQGVTIVVSRTSNSSGCDFFISVDGNYFPHRSLTLNSSSFDFDIYKESGRTNQIRAYSTGVTSSSYYITGSFSGSNTTASVIYYPYVDTSVLNPSGTYTGSYTFRLYSGLPSASPPSGSSSTSRSVTFSYVVASYANITISDSSTASSSNFNSGTSSKTMTFSPMTTAANQTTYAIIQFSDSYTLSLTSANGTSGCTFGYNCLKLTSGSNTYYAPYKLYADGSNSSTQIGTGTVVATGSNGSNGDGHGNGGTGTTGQTTYDSVALKIQLGTILSTLPAGTYSDTITLTVSAN
ncbi:MAG: hypothetical protein ACXVAX_02510 [Pseudobdellovibrio sp.]